MLSLASALNSLRYPVMTTIDYQRIGRILDRFSDLDPHQAYYIKDSVNYRHVGAVVPATRDVLRRALSNRQHVLDVGCGDGRRLIESHDLFVEGTGIDESRDHMIACAVRAKEEKGIRNLDFLACKAIQLPFAPDTFDMVFTERGPLGHSDGTLAEALRVLQPGGLVFIETGGSFTTLAEERERFQRFGLDIQTLTSRRYRLEFEEFYDLVTYLCSGWVYMGEELPSPEDRGRFEALLSESQDENGTISRVWETIWIAGSKPGQQSTRD